MYLFRGMPTHHSDKLHNFYVNISTCWEAATRGVLWKKVLLEISQNSQENTGARGLFFNKFASLKPAILLKKRLSYRCFPLNFAKFLRAAFSQNTSGQLLLDVARMIKNFLSSYGQNLNFFAGRKLLTKDLNGF